MNHKIIGGIIVLFLFGMVLLLITCEKPTGTVKTMKCECVEVVQ